MWKKLDEEGFRKFCAEFSLDKTALRAHIRMVEESEVFLKMKDEHKNLDNATANDVQSLVEQLVRDGKNTRENLLALLRYSRFAGNREAEIALMELLDACDVMKNVSETVRRTAGERKHNEIFGEIPLPPLGTHSRDKPRTTKKVMDRLEEKLGEQATREVLLCGPHSGPRERYLPEREAFLASKGIDDFLKQRHKEYVAELEEHMKNRTLYYTQEIDEDVVEYVRNTPTCRNGVRDIDMIYVTKIPYMAKEYLHEKDEKKKRYYYCHCPWVREGIISDTRVSPNFCYCSAAHAKRPWDVIFDQPVKAHVLETVLKGDLICKFAIQIPKKFLPSKDTTPSS